MIQSLFVYYTLYYVYKKNKVSYIRYLFHMVMNSYLCDICINLS